MSDEWPSRPFYTCLLCEYPPHGSRYKSEVEQHVLDVHDGYSEDALKASTQEPGESRPGAAIPDWYWRTSTGVRWLVQQQLWFTPDEPIASSADRRRMRPPRRR